MWERFETTTRAFLVSAEAVFRARRDDPAFDFSGPAVEYAKAVETELNALVFPRLRKRLGGGLLKDREVRIGGAFSHADAGWLRSTAPRELRGIVDLRNPAAHSKVIDRERVEAVRALVLGIGCEGVLVRLARARGSP